MHFHFGEDEDPLDLATAKHKYWQGKSAEVCQEIEQLEGLLQLKRIDQTEFSATEMNWEREIKLLEGKIEV